MNYQYGQPINYQFSQFPISVPPPPSPPKKRSRVKTILVVFLLLVLIISLVSAGLFFAWDYLFKKDPDFTKGVEVAWSAKISESEDYRYVEPINDKKLVLFSISSDREGSAFYIDIPDNSGNAQKEVTIKAEAVKDLPHCRSNSSRPYRVANNRIACNTVEDETIDSARIAGIHPTLLSSLGEKVLLAGKSQGVVFAYSSAAQNSHLLGLDKKYGFLWDKTFAGKINVTAKGDFVWVVEKDRISAYLGAVK